MTWRDPGWFLNYVLLDSWIAGGVVEGFAGTAVVRDAVVGDVTLLGAGGPRRWGVALGFLFAALHERLVGLALSAAEGVLVTRETLELDGAGLQDLSAEQRQVGFGLVGVAFLVSFECLFHRMFDEVGFEAHDAAHAPFGVGHLTDEGAFVGSVG